jgi:hypothetical protein
LAGGCGVNSPGLWEGPLSGCRECGNEPSGSGATEWVSYRYLCRNLAKLIHTYIHTCVHTYLRTYIHTHISTYAYTHVRTYVLTYIHTYIYTVREAYSYWIFKKVVQSFIRAMITYRPDVADSKYLWNVGKLIPDYMEEHARGQPYADCLRIFRLACRLSRPSYSLLLNHINDICMKVTIYWFLIMQVCYILPRLLPFQIFQFHCNLRNCKALLIQCWFSFDSE